MNSTIKKEQGSSRALICDLDGTLIEFPFYDSLKFSFLRLLCLGIFSKLPGLLQVRLAKPTPYLEMAKDYQNQGIELFLVTSRRDSTGSRRKIEFLLRKLKLEFKPESILMRPPNQTSREHKRESAKKIANQYEEVEIIEDEKRFYKGLSQWGSLVEIIS